MQTQDLADQLKMKAEAAAVEFEEEEEKMAQMLDDGEVDPEALKAQEARLKEKERSLEDQATMSDQVWKQVSKRVVKARELVAELELTEVRH